MQKQVAEVALSTAILLYDQHIAEQDIHVRTLEAQLYAARVCLDSSKQARMEFVRFVERNDKRAPSNNQIQRVP